MNPQENKTMNLKTEALDEMIKMWDGEDEDGVMAREELDALKLAYTKAFQALAAVMSDLEHKGRVMPDAHHLVEEAILEGLKVLT